MATYLSTWTSFFVDPLLWVENEILSIFVILIEKFFTRMWCCWISFLTIFQPFCSYIFAQERFVNNKKITFEGRRKGLWKLLQTTTTGFRVGEIGLKSIKLVLKNLPVSIHCSWLEIQAKILLSNFYSILFSFLLIHFF